MEPEERLFGDSFPFCGAPLQVPCCVGERPQSVVIGFLVLPESKCSEGDIHKWGPKGPHQHQDLTFSLEDPMQVGFYKPQRVGS